jgi:hypothetical protein
MGGSLATPQTFRDIEWHQAGGTYHYGDLSATAWWAGHCYPWWVAPVINDSDFNVYTKSTHATC